MMDLRADPVIVVYFRLAPLAPYAGDDYARIGQRPGTLEAPLPLRFPYGDQLDKFQAVMVSEILTSPAKAHLHPSPQAPGCMSQDKAHLAALGLGARKRFRFR